MQLRHLLIDRRHALLIDVKILIIRMEFNAVQAQRTDAFQFLQRIWRIGMHRAEGIEPFAAHRCGKVIDLVHGVNGSGDVLRHSTIHAPSIHFFQRSSQRAIGIMRRVAVFVSCDARQLFDGFHRQRIREEMHMKINLHKSKVPAFLSIRGDYTAFPPAHARESTKRALRLPERPFCRFFAVLFSSPRPPFRQPAKAD